MRALHLDDARGGGVDSERLRGREVLDGVLGRGESVGRGSASSACMLSLTSMRMMVSFGGLLASCTVLELMYQGRARGS